MSEHHHVFSHFLPFAGEAQANFEIDFLGCKIRHEFWPSSLRTGIPKRTYPPFDEEYFEWIDLLESVVQAQGTYTIVELGAGFVSTFSQFLALRSLFGIAMGGVWGLASSTALENLPVEVRGLASGVLQQGYAFGYLIAAVINLRVVPHTSLTWRALFWASAAISGFAAFVRLLVPESVVFLQAKALEREKGSVLKISG